MSKLTMEEYGKVAAMVLSLPRKNRDMLSRAIDEKADKEDEALKLKAMEVKP